MWRKALGGDFITLRKIPDVYLVYTLHIPHTLASMRTYLIFTIVVCLCKTFYRTYDRETANNYNT